MVCGLFYTKARQQGDGVNKKDRRTSILPDRPGRLPYLEERIKDGYRQTFAEDDTCSPYIPHLGLSHYSFALNDFPVHIHHGCFELVYVVSGHPVWEIESQNYFLKPTDCFLTLPDETHGNTCSVMEPCELLFVQVDRTASETVRSLSELLRTLEKTQHRQFTGSPRIRQLLELMLKECRNPQDFSETAQESHLKILLIETVRCAENYRTNIPLSFGVKQALELVANGPLDVLTPETLRKASRLGRTEFFRRFARETGETPNQVLIRRRIVAAQLLLLKSKKSITEIAFEVGFSSSQYFSSVFRRYVGLSPCTYRRANSGM